MKSPRAGCCRNPANNSRVKKDLTPAQHAEWVVSLYRRGIICPSEMRATVLEHVTPETLDEYMSRLTPEQDGYFRSLIAFVEDAPLGEQARMMRQLMREWYEKQPR